MGCAASTQQHGHAPEKSAKVVIADGKPSLADVVEQPVKDVTHPTKPGTEESVMEAHKSPLVGDGLASDIRVTSQFNSNSSADPGRSHDKMAKVWSTMPTMPTQSLDNFQLSSGGIDAEDDRMQAIRSFRVDRSFQKKKQKIDAQKATRVRHSSVPNIYTREDSEHGIVESNEPKSTMKETSRKSVLSLLDGMDDAQAAIALKHLQWAAQETGLENELKDAEINLGYIGEEDEDEEELSLEQMHAECLMI
mmetsp:Transcript_28689/g.44940  ORF Transcript_28689/g.44940 Transcript_28689/m.44940 type:complete len:250 (-) Transcript_28689:210-959(-)